LHLEPLQIEADLRQLRAITSCVRTYGVDHGLAAVPAIARALGMRVVLGAWINGDAAEQHGAGASGRWRSPATTPTWSTCW
jgi:exo-beta-1,3-glucanase (GH17 family)